MTLTIAHITPLVALLAGILILIVPRLLSFIVAIYLIIVELIGLNAMKDYLRSAGSRRISGGFLYRSFWV
jgi:hypothetical protein